MYIQLFVHLHLCTICFFLFFFVLTRDIQVGFQWVFKISGNLDHYLDKLCAKLKLYVPKFVICYDMYNV